MHKLQSRVFPILALFLFIVTFAIKVFIDGPYSRGEVSTAVAYSKYGTALVACVLSVLFLYKKKKTIFLTEYKQMMLVVILFTAVTVVQQCSSGIFSSTSYIELVKLIMPVILAYLMLNTLDFDTFYGCMTFILWMSFIAYLIDLKNSGASIFDIFYADYSTSSSKTEHSGLSGIALAFVFFFTYFGKNRFYMYFAVFFCICTFKRLAICFAVIALLIKILYPELMNKQISKSSLFFLKILTMLITGFWFWLLLPEQEHYIVSWFEKSTFDFTSGRSGMMRYLLEHSFKSYGFGSTNDIINRLFDVPFELDFIKIAFELSPILLFVFVFVFWNISGRVFWGVYIIGFYVLNMITSDCLQSNFSLTLVYMVIGAINYYPEMVKNKKIISLQKGRICNIQCIF